MTRITLKVHVSCKAIKVSSYSFFTSYHDQNQRSVVCTSNSILLVSQMPPSHHQWWTFAYLFKTWLNVIICYIIACSISQVRKCCKNICIGNIQHIFLSHLSGSLLKSTRMSVKPSPFITIQSWHLLWRSIITLSLLAPVVKRRVIKIHLTFEI